MSDMFHKKDSNKISIIVPIFRVEKYLSKCISSIINQSFKNIEIILVNDGSDDNSRFICENFAKTDKRIVLINKKNGGLVSARKAGVLKASGKYLTFVDGDDWIDSEHIKKLHSNLDLNVDLVVTNFKRDFLGKRKVIKNHFPDGTYEAEKLEKTILPKAIYTGNFFEHGINTYVWNKLFLTHKIKKIISTIDNKIVMGEDSCITYPYIFQSKKIVITSNPTYIYRQRQDSIIKQVKNLDLEYQKIKLLFENLTNSLKIYFFKYGIYVQILNYLYSLLLNRSGGNIALSETNENIVFKDLRNSKIILLSSGSFGQIAYTFMKNISDIKISAWVDNDHIQSKKVGLDVESVASVMNFKFDKVFIASTNPTFVESSFKKLTNLGVDPDKIISAINIDRSKLRAASSNLCFDLDSYLLKNNFLKKKLIILGGNPETIQIVKKAKEMGVKTIVIDPNSNSPAKKYAHESFNYDGFDIENIKKIFRATKSDGILVGVADVLVEPYKVLCDQLSLPCYANSKSISVLTDKENFAKTCNKFDISTIPTYNANPSEIKDYRKIIFPVIVKPVDSGGGIGMEICYNNKQLKKGISNATIHSKNNRVVIEKLMRCDDMLAYYNFIDGTPHLAACADRFTTKKQKKGSPVCIGAIYPSKHTSSFKRTIHKKFMKMFDSLQIKDGVLNMQFFVENNEFFAYDPGFRLQGEAPHVYLNKLNNVDNIRMLIDFALGNDRKYLEESNALSPFFSKCCCTMWVLLKEGLVSNVEGLTKISSSPNTIKIINRVNIGDEITHDMIGTEKQVFARIYLAASNFIELKQNVDKVNNTLKILDNNGNNMIIDVIKGKQLEDYIT